MNSSRQQRIIEHFRRSIHSYDDGAKAQKMVGDTLIAKMSAYGDIQYDRVLEVGCCTGSMTETLCRNNSVGELWLNDLVPECCYQAGVRVAALTGDIHYVAGDIELLPIPDGLDLIVSSSTFQWLRNLQVVFEKFAASLNDHGFLAFTIFGPGTMHQVRELIGIGLDYTSEGDLAKMLEKNFSLIELETLCCTLHFQTPREVLRHIQATGVGGAGTYRWTPAKLRAFDHEYRLRFGTEKGIPLDYVSTCIIARKG